MLNQKYFWFIVSIALPFLSLSAVFSTPAASPAGTYTVCASGCDFISIQAAIDAAGSGDTISLAGETFTEPFTVDKSLTIEGAGSENTILQAATAPVIATSRVITITTGSAVTITGVTIRFGNALGGAYPGGYGGGILNQAGNLTLQHSIVISNIALSGGGGIHNTDGALLVVDDSTFVSNSVGQYGSGSGIRNYDSSRLEVFNSTFYGQNESAISTERNSTLSVTNSIFEANEGGGIYSTWNCTVTVTTSTFLSNTAVSGGGIYNGSSSKMTISDSVFQGNSASPTYQGGAIKNYNSDVLTIINTVFINNDATYGGGIFNENHSTAIIMDSTFYSNTAISGGAIYNTSNSSVVLVNSSTFYGNRATSGYGGSISNSEIFTLTNSTISDNSAGIAGGGISNYFGGSVTISNSTLSNNSAGSHGGGITNEQFGVLNLVGTIIADSQSGGDCYNETGLEAGIVYDYGYNIVEEGTCIAASSSMAVDPMLDVLQDNGGDTLTQALLEGSPAINVIPTGMCAVTEDQRGIPRPQGAGCDIGAYEGVTDYRVYLPLVVKQ